MRNKILSILVVFAMLFPFGILANTVNAEDAVTEILVIDNPRNESETDTIKNAIAKVEKVGKGIIKLGKDITSASDNDEITFTTGEVTLNLNGHKLEGSSDKNQKDILVVKDGAKLTITNNEETDKPKAGIVIKAESEAAICNTGDVTITGNLIISDDNVTTPYYAIENYGNMTIEDGVQITTTKHKSSLILNGKSDNGHSNDSELKGIFNVDGKNAAKRQSADLTITGGKFNGGKYVVKNDQFGVLKISGGSFTNDLKDESQPNKSAGTGSNYAVILNSNIATITDGEFTLKNVNTKSGVKAVDIINRAGENGKGSNGYMDGNYKGASLIVNGGSFTGVSDIFYDSVAAETEVGKGVQNTTDVNAGNFNKDIKAYLEDEDVEVLVTTTTSNAAKYYVGEDIAEAVKDAKYGTTVDVKQGAVDLKGIPDGVQVKNSTSGNITVDGTEVKAGETVKSSDINAANKDAEMESLKADLTEAQNKNKDLEEDLATAQDKIEDLEKDLATAQDEIGDLKNQIAKLTEQKPAVSVAKTTGVKASSQTTTSVKVSWSKVSGATGYRVYRCTTKGGKYTKVADVKTTSYTDKKLKTGTAYYYKVRAYKTVDGKNTYGAYSTVLGTSTKTKTPSVKLTAGSKKATAKWAKVSGATGYRVYMRTGKSGSYKKVADIKSTSYTKKSLKKGTTYYFKVRAYKTVSGKNVYSSYSTAKSVKVK